MGKIIIDIDENNEFPNTKEEFEQKYPPIITYGELKETEIYINASDTYLCVNGEDPIDEMYYPDILDDAPVIGTGHGADGSLQIDIIVKNWDKRYEPDWMPEFI